MSDERPTEDRHIPVLRDRCVNLLAPSIERAIEANGRALLAKAAPRVAMKVANKITGDETKLAVELNFKHIDDFEPARVAEQISPLRDLLEMRKRLTQLLSKMEGNDKLEQLLAEIINNTDKAREMAKQMGLDAGEADGPGAEA